MKISGPQWPVSDFSLNIEDGEKVINVSCHFGEKSLYFQEALSDPENSSENCQSTQRILSIKHNSNNNGSIITGL